MNKLEYDIRKMQELQKKYEDHIYERIDQYIKLAREYRYKGLSGSFGIDIWEFNGNKIDISFTEYGSYGYHEPYSISMPIDYLWDESWLEKAIADFERKKEEERLAKEKADYQQKKAQEERDRAKYEELKERFGD